MNLKLLSFILFLVFICTYGQTPSEVFENANAAYNNAKYEKADLPKLVEESFSHLTSDECQKLLQLLIKYEGLFDGTLGD